MNADADGARYERERAFHDGRYRDDGDRSRAEKFYESGDESAKRYRALLATIPAGAAVLEYGCGTGSAAFDIAARGAKVLGIDISPVAISTASSEAVERGLGDGLRFATMNAEDLDLPDDSIDVVCGSGVLHHLDVSKAFSEITRVLRADGWAVFVEPLGHNPLINAYRRSTPEMRTPDEHPLRESDIVEARRCFEVVEVDAFNLLTLAVVPLRRYGFQPWLRALLHRADQALFRWVPPLRRHAWVAVLRLAGPRAR